MSLLNLRRAGAAALFVASTCAAVSAAALLEIHRHLPTYVMPVSVVLTAGLCVALTAAGGLVAVRGRTMAPWLAPGATSVLCIGFLEARVLIAIPLVILVLLSTRTFRRSVPSRRGLGAAMLLTFGLVPLGLLLLFGRPVVQCFPNGVSMSAPIWTWSGDGGGSGSMSGQSGDGSNASPGRHRVEGTVTTGGTTYAYTCDSNKLIRFALVPRA